MDQVEVKNPHDKGFNMFNTFEFRSPNEYASRIKVGVKQLDDAVLKLGSLSEINGIPKSKQITKGRVLKALAEHDLPELRKISNLFYDINGIYRRTCDYFSCLYRYDWYIAPEINDDSIKEEKILKDFAKLLNFLDDSHLKKKFGEIALEIIKNGCYYGYIVPSADGLVIQQLPANYCRTRYTVGNDHAIEFNMKFFDTFRDLNYRIKVLKLFPEEFAKGYRLYCQGKLVSDSTNESDNGWYLLDVANTVKFNFNGSDIPVFINAIPALLDLDAAQDLDRKKQMQKLLKIIIQKLPLDKNGDLIFDIDEARDIHNNAVEMLRRAIGTDVLTTFTDVEMIDLADKNATASQDDLEKVERTAFNTMGISRNLFNTDGNLSLEKSILNDESTVRNLLLQFNVFMDKVIRKINPNVRKYNFKFYFLETTQYNYQTLSKLYKEQTQIGYSKMLPQIALGHSQSSILNSIHFENDVLHLVAIMLPPMQSSVMNAEALGLTTGLSSSDSKSSGGKSNNQNGNVGRPQKEEGEKSEKTIQNLESQS